MWLDRIKKNEEERRLRHEEDNRRLKEAAERKKKEREERRRAMQNPNKFQPIIKVVNPFTTYLRNSIAIVKARTFLLKAIIFDHPFVFILKVLFNIVEARFKKLMNNKVVISGSVNQWKFQ